MKKSVGKRLPLSRGPFAGLNLYWLLAIAGFLAPLPALAAATAVGVSFNPNPVQPGGTSTLTFTFLNSGSGAVTVSGTAFSLPAGVTIAAAPALSDTCGFSGNSVAGGATSFTIGSNGSVPAGNTGCSISFNVQAPAAGGNSYDLSIPAGAFQTSDGSNPPSTNSTATLRTLNFQAVQITFTSPPHILANSSFGTVLSDTPQNRSLVYKLTNPNLVPLTGVTLNVPQALDGNFLSGTGEILTTTCGGTLTLGATTKQPVLSGATIPAGGSCIITESLRWDQALDVYFAGDRGPTFPAAILTSDQGVTNAQGSFSYTFQRGVNYGKTFDKSTTGVNQTVTMTLVVQSYESYPVTYSIPDAIPSGFHVTAISAAAGINPPDSADNCAIPGVSLPAAGTVNFTGTLGATYSSTNNGAVNSSCTYTVTLKTDNVQFGVTPPSNTVQTLSNTLATDSNQSGTATAPAVTFTSPNGPGGAVQNVYAAAVPGPAQATLSVFNCDPSVANCASDSLTVAKTFTDSLGNVTPSGGTGNLPWGGDGYFTITIGASNGHALTGLSLNDQFTNATANGNNVIVATPTTFLAGPTNTCGGVLTATPGANGFSLSGGTLAAGATCQVTVPVHRSSLYIFSSNPNVVNNLIPGDVFATDVVTTNTLVNTSPTGVTLNAIGSAYVVSGLTATNNAIVAGGSTQEVLTFGKNSGIAPISNGDFTWDLSPASGGAIFEATGVVSNTCGSSVQVVDSTTGTPVSVSAPSQKVHVTGIVMADGTATALAAYSVAGQLIDTTAYQSQSCQIVLDIKEANTTTGQFQMNGSFITVNNHPVIGDASTNAPQSAGQTVNVVTPSPMSITKSFSPSPAAAGAAVMLAITLDNSTGTVVDLSGIDFTDSYPNGLVNGATPNAQLAAAASHTCSGVGVGTLTAQAGGNSVSWSGGTMKAGDVCVLSVSVSPLASGLTNTITPASLSNDQGVTTTTFSLPLGTTQSIGVTKQFSPDTIWSGQTSTLKINLINFYSNATDAGTLSVTDTLPAGVTASGNAVDVDNCGILATVTPSTITMSGGSVPTNGSCEIDVIVTSTTPSATAYTNTIPVGAMTANIGGIATKNDNAATAPLYVYAPITVTKTVTGGPGTGATATFGFTADCGSNGSFTTNVTLTGTTTGTSTISGVPSDSTCSVSETTIPSAPTNYQWGATPPAVSMTTTAAGPNAAAFTNALTRQTGAIALTKTVTGGPSGGVTGTFGFTANCGVDGTFAGTVALANATSGTGSIANVPAGATCSVSETTIPSAPTNYQWGATPPAVSVTTTVAGPNTAAFTNALTRQTGDLVIAKTVTGGPTAGVTATFGFTADCGSNGSFTTSIALTSATTGTGTISGIPAGSACSVSETTIPSPPTYYQWGAPPAAVTLTTTATGPNTAAFVNTLTAIDPPFTLTKTISGGPSGGVSGTFTFNIDCGAEGTFTQSVMLANATSGNVSITNIPGGTSCTFSESSNLPSAPSGFAWGALPAVQTKTIDGTAVSFTNVLTSVTPTQQPVATPMLNGWVLTLLGLATVLAGAVGTRSRIAGKRL